MSRPPIVRIVPFVALIGLVVTSPVSGQAYKREQDEVRAARQHGALSVREVEHRILPRMSGCDYLGPEFYSESNSYRLKFMRAGSLIWIDVDARTGNVIGRFGD